MNRTYYELSVEYKPIYKKEDIKIISNRLNIPLPSDEIVLYILVDYVNLTYINIFMRYLNDSENLIHPILYNGIVIMP